MVTAFNVGEDVNITIKSRIASVSIQETNGKPLIRYDVVFTMPGGGITRKMISEDELLKLAEVEESKNESET